ESLAGDADRLGRICQGRGHFGRRRYTRTVVAHHGGDQGEGPVRDRRGGRCHRLAGRLQFPVGVVFRLGGGRGGMNRLWAVVLCFVAITAAAQERPAAPSDYRQTAAVLAHYPVVADMQLNSPAFRTAQPTLTSQQALADFLAALARESRQAKVASIGQSTQGRDIPIVYLTAEGLVDPAAIRRLGRPVIWLIGQQHGNEPAGGEAMLALASALARG